MRSGTVDSVGPSLITAGTAVTAVAGPNTFVLNKGSPVTAAGATQFLCFKVTAGAGLAQGRPERSPGSSPLRRSDAEVMTGSRLPESPRASIKVRAALAGGLVFGLAAGLTVASWTDAERVGATFTASSFNLQTNVQSAGVHVDRRARRAR